MRLIAAARLILVAALFATPAFADGKPRPTPNVAAPPVRAAPVQPPVGPAPIGQTGAIALPQSTGLALNVPRGYRYYSADEARAFLARNNASPPPGDILGLLAPAGTRIDLPDSWGTVIAFEPIGYVPNDNAAALSNANFEGQVRSARSSQSRPFEGFAIAPSFAESNPCVTWAERTAAPGQGGHDLRFEQRLMGRNGVTDLTSIGSADQMTAMQAAAPELLRMVTFGAGQRYSDYNPASDQKSRFDIPGLVTGQPVATAQNLTGEAASAEGAPATSSPIGGGLMGLFPWIAGGVVLLAGAGYMLMRKRKPAEEDYDDDPNVNPEA